MKISSISGLTYPVKGEGAGPVSIELHGRAWTPEEISVADIITATEGPVALTQCTVSLPGLCVQESCCPVHGNWQKINEAIRQALDGVKLSEMARPLARQPGSPNKNIVPREARVS